jgi:pyruvyl transferase EpsO
MTMNHSERVLSDLKERLTEITNVLHLNSSIVYIDYPLHRNIGDLLINLGTERFFEKHRLRVKRRYNILELPTTLPDIEPTDTLVFHGGGNLGDLYPEHLDAMESILKAFPLNRAIQLPQTVQFDDDCERERRCTFLKGHRQLSIFVRDARSLAALQDHDVPDVHLMPDMAHQLYGELFPAKPMRAIQNLYLFRSDVEGGKIPDLIAGHSGEAVDWDACIHRIDRLTLAFLRRLVRLMRYCGRSMDVHRVWYKYRDNMVKSGISFLSTPECIYTNRLHCLLLAVLLGKEVHWFDNSYGKLSSYVNTWFSELPTVSQVS